MMKNSVMGLVHGVTHEQSILADNQVLCFAQSLVSEKLRQSVEPACAGYFGQAWLVYLKQPVGPACAGYFGQAWLVLYT
jgi:hypothetical protein